MPRKTPKKVRAVDILLDILRDEGATTIFGNPGSTEMPLMDALVDAPDFRYVLGLQEATGYTKAANLASNVGSLLIFLGAGSVNFAAGGAMIAGQLIGARLGSGMVIKHGAKFIRPVFLTVVFAMTVKLILDAWSMGHGAGNP